MTEKKEMESFSEKDTFLIGKQFAEGLGIEEPITSPTFTLIQEYMEGRLPFYHFDVYRIGDVEEMYDIGIDEYLFGDGVCLIEWPSRIEEILPDTCENIWIEKDLEKGFDYRRITCDKEGDRES